MLRSSLGSHLYAAPDMVGGRGAKLGDELKSNEVLGPAKGQWFEPPAKCLQTGHFLTRAGRDWATTTQWLPGDANAPADCAHKKDLQIQAVFEAAEGIRTLDLLHGKQTL
jgi:hypothetical protein